jgi:hypothetical protein
MKRPLPVLLVLLTVSTGVLSTSALGQPPLFLWGNVRWSTGYPASGLEVRLIQTSTQTIARSAYTNQAGRFAFFGVGGQPSAYSLQVYTGNTMRGHAGLSEVPLGGQAPDVTVD